MAFPTKTQVERIKSMYPKGTRIKLISMDDPYSPIESGTTGTVIFVDDAGQIQMQWDNGRSLALIADEDDFTIIGKEVVS